MRLPTRLLRRKVNSHKGDFGRVLILAGSAGLTGAAALCSKACLLCGAGLVTLGIPESLNKVFIKIKEPEIMTLPLEETKEGSLSPRAFEKIKEFCRNIDVLAIGPGLSRNASTLALAGKVIKSFPGAMVIDADGLNALNGHLELLAGRGVKVLTPHSGEMGGLLGTDVKEIEKNRKKVAKYFVNRYNIILVLKGHRTLVAEKGKSLYVNKTGNPGMAKGGSGDVLTGMIAAFLAQGLSGFQAAKYAVYLHGLCGDLAARDKTQIAMTASDIIDNIPRAIKRSS